MWYHRGRSDRGLDSAVPPPIYTTKIEFGDDLSIFMPELTRQQIEGQDFVDNEVFELIQRLAPSAKIKWNIGIICVLFRGLIFGH